MNAYPIIAEAAWVRLAIVGLDILAVAATVRFCGLLGAWWRTHHPPGPSFAPGRLTPRSRPRR
jgi:hypothetical protein